MARKAKVKWDLQGFEDIRRSPAVGRLLDDEVRAVLGKVTDGDFTSADYTGGVEQGRTRLRGYVVTTSLDAIKRESRDKTLLKALGGG